MEDTIKVIVANEKHLAYVETILDTIEKAAKVRGTGIAKRSPEYVKQKMLEGKAIIALDGDKFAGFCYIESWSNKKYVANSGLIVVESYRGHGLAKRIKRKAFELSREKFPDAKIFGLTTGLAVMKINSEMGYRPVTFSELTDDDAFWRGCQSCVNYDILQRTNRRMCLCTGMLYDPHDPHNEHQEEKTEEKNNEPTK
ncbi:MAG TPA: GNAT family N-acetyltransferase [Candidatus Gallibacteroides avistercoris]|uniref:GNAT family N-acetyltransferase n=1 Tax=Candidatus Gallibacteroides avistercoris TaxID=2840833 RepID=A0A9D1M6L9_9BACT|nr:GNAT family N-acetyltransferase [Candidatus Gallibacteroides avistercoris]